MSFFNQLCKPLSKLDISTLRKASGVERTQRQSCSGGKSIYRQNTTDEVYGSLRKLSSFFTFMFYWIKVSATPYILFFL